MVSAPPLPLKTLLPLSPRTVSAPDVPIRFSKFTAPPRVRLISAPPVVLSSNESVSVPVPPSSLAISSEVNAGVPLPPPTITETVSFPAPISTLSPFLNLAEEIESFPAPILRVQSPLIVSRSPLRLAFKFKVSANSLPTTLKSDVISVTC